MNWLLSNRLTVKQHPIMAELFKRGPNGTLEGFLMTASERAVAESLVRRGLVERGRLDTRQRGVCYRITRRGIDLLEDMGYRI